MANHPTFSRRDQVGSALLKSWEFFILLSVRAGAVVRKRVPDPYLRDRPED